MELLPGNCDHTGGSRCMVNSSWVGLIWRLAPFVVFPEKGGIKNGRLSDNRRISQPDSCGYMESAARDQAAPSAMMLSELIDHSKRVSQTPQRPELGPLTNDPFNPG